MAKSNTKVMGTGPETYEYKEGEVASGATVYPGMALEYTGTNADGDPLVQPVDAADYDGPLRIALTPESPPKGADSDVPVEHEYSAGESVQFAIPYPGAVIQNALLANGTDTGAMPTQLGTSDDGSLTTTSTAGAVLANALEDVNNGGGSDQGGISAARIRVEVR